jgi:hypothetical protein
MLNKRKIAVNVFIFFILAFTISCTGKKDAKNADKTLSGKQAAIETQDIDSDWVISDDFRNINHSDTIYGFKVDYMNKMATQAINDILAPYNMRLKDSILKTIDSLENYSKKENKKGNFPFIEEDLVLNSVHIAKIPPIPDNSYGWSRIAFFADFRPPNFEYFKQDSDPAVYFLVFYEKDGIIEDFTHSFLGVVPIINSTYNILKYIWINDMPYRRFKDSSVIIRDFNGDGYDEIMLFFYDIEGTRICKIFNWPEEDSTFITNEFEQIFEAPLWIWLPYFTEETWNYGPPVQFGTYKGKEGFLICEDTQTDEMTKQYYGPESLGYDLVPVHKGIWNFYAWDKEERKYVFVDRVNPDEIKTQWAKIGKSRN